MSIGTSDGRQFDSWFDYYAQEGKAEPVIDHEDSQDMTNRGVKHMRQDIKDQSPAPRRPSSDPEKPTGELEIDRGHSVPLLAASTPTGMAIDYRANTNMEFEGKTHDITPFLLEHENAERGAYYAAKDRGMDPKAAYEQAHDMVALPAETSKRNAYAIANDLNPEEFGKAYNAHLQSQMRLAEQPTDVPRHPEAHTNDFEHHYIKQPTRQQKQDFQMKEGKDIEDQVLPKEEIKSLFPQELKDNPSPFLQNIPTSSLKNKIHLAGDVVQGPWGPANAARTGQPNWEKAIDKLQQMTGGSREQVMRALQESGALKNNVVPMGGRDTGSLQPVE